MNLNEIGMLIVSSPRSNAYLQALLKKELYPAHIIIMENQSDKLSPGQISADVLEKLNLKDDPEMGSHFDLDVSLEEVIKSHHLSYDICPTQDVNSNQVIDKVKNRPEKYFIYSGSGGVILKEKILSCGKRFLHIHPGSVPDYRGSTTVYYTILNEDLCFASAFFLDRNIDTGPFIKTKTYSKPNKGEIIDYIYDPYIRSDLLVEVIEDYLKNGEFQTKEQDEIGGETYFIIHPVLKHIAILSCIKNRFILMSTLNIKADESKSK